MVNLFKRFKLMVLAQEASHLAATTTLLGMEVSSPQPTCLEVLVPASLSPLPQATHVLMLLTHVHEYSPSSPSSPSASHPSIRCLDCIIEDSHVL